MSPFLQLAFLLAVILFAAKMAGYVSIRLGQPSVLGELIIGVLLGPSLVDLLHASFLTDIALEEIIIELGEIGVLLLMFIAGLELHLDEMRETGKVSGLAGTLGVIFPFTFGAGVAFLFGLDWEVAVFLGLTVGATSVSISAQTLMELKMLRTRVGLGLLGAAVFDDILVILFISIFFALTSGGGDLTGILGIIGNMLIFFTIALGFGIWAIPPLSKWVKRLPISQNVLSFAIVVMLVYALAAELIGGMATITGAFLAGLMFARTQEREILVPRISALSYSFFVPIFFVSIGLTVDVSTIVTGAGFAGVLILAAIIGKLIGGGLGARAAGFSWLESMQLSMGMVSRGEVGLIFAIVGAEAGLVDDAVFSAIVGMVVVTTLITPPVLRYLFSDRFIKATPDQVASGKDNLSKVPSDNKPPSG